LIVELVYEQFWHTYEEWGGIRIYCDADGVFYYSEGGYSVMAEKYNDDPWNSIELCSGEYALELIDTWERIALEYDDYFS
jgi:hypothetical protein